MIRKLATFWLRKVHPRIATLITTIGVVGLASSLLILFVVAKLADEVLEKEVFEFDTTLLLWIHQFSNPSLDAVMLVITRLGDPEVIIPIVGIILVILWLRHYRQEAQIFLIACIGGAILNTGLKLFFGKPRPELWPRLIAETSYSFPSGHALGSMVVYGLLAYLVTFHYPRFIPFIYIFAAVLIAVIGISRLYLGVHWPTDIIAGYGVGFLWLMICTTMFKLQVRNRQLNI
jgi:membrane-associated phospholipid phosphatase